MGTPCSACNKRVIAGRLTLGGTGLVFHRIKKGKNRGKVEERTAMLQQVKAKSVSHSNENGTVERSRCRFF
jgi:hypothetical protein